MYLVGRNYLDKDDEKMALKVLVEHGTINGITKLQDVLELVDVAGNSLLMHELLVDNYGYLSILNDVGYSFDWATVNMYAVSPRLMLHWSKNKRIMKVVADCELTEVHPTKLQDNSQL